MLFINLFVAVPAVGFEVFEGRLQGQLCDGRLTPMTNATRVHQAPTPLPRDAVAKHRLR